MTASSFIPLRRDVQRRLGGRRSPQSGASLIEVLVAVLLVSVGLLGIAGLSGATYGYNKNAQIRLVGMGLVNDYADRARVNVYGFDLGSYSITKGTDPGDITVPTLDPDATDNATAAGNVALYDKADFLTAVKDRLPEGTAVVDSDISATGRGMDVWLLWKEPQNEDDTLFTTAQENCPKSIVDDADDKKVYSCMYFKVGL
jgi:type IV pilus assembly protein PilV